MAHIRSFDEIRGDSGTIAALNAYFEVHQSLPEEKTRGEYYEAVGCSDLDPQVEDFIKSHYSR